MGSEATVDVFKKIDAAWLVRDYETMKAHICLLYTSPSPRD